LIFIFCLCEKTDQRSVEHIIPESLGGGDWAVLPSGTVCDSCNQYFGSKVESHVLQDYPFNVLRLFSGVITKRGRFATVSHPIGKLSASPFVGVLGLEPCNEEIEHQIVRGVKSQFRIIAETKQPLLMCRFLLKIALECVARDCVSDALSETYAGARRFARHPGRGDSWWFMYRYDAATDGGHNNMMRVEILDIGGAEMGLITVFGCDFFVPLTREIIYSAESELREPEYRYFLVHQ
jgi:hypothetical protein